MLNCILWNCRGANKPNLRRSIRYIIKKFDMDILALFETHAGGDRASRICRNLGFENSFRVDAIGQSGGLWLLWKTSVGEVEVLASTNYYIILYSCESGERRRVFKHDCCLRSTNGE